MSIEGQGHFFKPYIFQVLYVLCFTRPRYQVSVTGPLVLCFFFSFFFFYSYCPFRHSSQIYSFNGHAEWLVPIEEVSNSFILLAVNVP